MRQSSSGGSVRWSDQHTCLDFASQPAVTRWHKPATLLISPKILFIYLFCASLSHQRFEWRRQGNRRLIRFEIFASEPLSKTRSVKFDVGLDSWFYSTRVSAVFYDLRFRATFNSIHSMAHCDKPYSFLITHKETVKSTKFDHLTGTNCEEKGQVV